MQKMIIIAVIAIIDISLEINYHQIQQKLLRRNTLLRERKEI
jgi:hypothetical protein